MIRKRRRAHIHPWQFSPGGKKGYWIGLVPAVDVNGLMPGSGTSLRYRDVDYDTLKDVVPAALGGYQAAGEYGLTFKEDVDGKSWFLVHAENLTTLITNHPFIYHLIRLSLDGATAEKDFTYSVDVTSVGDDDLTIPCPFVTSSGYNAAFGIQKDGDLWIPTKSGARRVSKDNGSLQGSAVAWPVSMVALDGAGIGLTDQKWRLRGFLGGVTGLLAQFTYLDCSTRIDPGPPLVQYLTVNDVQWEWWYLPWDDTTWTKWVHVDIADHSEHTFGYWQGTDAPLSPWDFYYDVGGCDPVQSNFYGVVNRAFSVANELERDYRVNVGGLQLRDAESSYRRRRPVWTVDGDGWVLAAATQFGAIRHQEFDGMTTALLGTQTDEVPDITAPQSQWRADAEGPAS